MSWAALRFSYHRGERKFFVCTNSLNFLSALDNPGRVETLSQLIMVFFHAVEDLGSSFTFAWYPGHVGIEEKEEADAAARHDEDRSQ